MSLSSMETSLCHREARDKEKESAHGMMEGERKEARLLPLPSSHCPMSAFCCLIIGIPGGKLCGGESCYMCLHCICAMIEM